MTLGMRSEEAKVKELKGYQMSWTEEFWVGPSDESHSALTARCIEEKCKKQSTTINFKVLKVRAVGESTHADVHILLEKFQDEATVVFDTFGITEADGRTGVLRVYCRDNDRWNM